MKNEETTENKALHYIRVYESSTGGYVDLHPLHGEDELYCNLDACRRLADKGHKLELLPVLGARETELRKLLLGDVFGKKNPDVRINKSFIGDIKTPNKFSVTKTTIKDCICRSAKQKVEIVIIDLFEANYSFSQIKEALLSGLPPHRNKSIRNVWILTYDNNLLIIPRKMIMTAKFYQVLDRL